MKTNPENFTLVTGSSAGIGKQLAFECARKGFSLFLVSLPGTGLPEVAKEIREAFPVKVETLEIDLTGLEAPQKVYEYTQEKGIRVNMTLFNCTC